jgi:hypothetical protein
MVGAGAIVAGLQALGIGLPLLFAALGVLTFAALPIIVRVWGSADLGAFGKILLRWFPAGGERPGSPPAHR